MSRRAPEYNIQVGQSETHHMKWTFCDSKRKPVDITTAKFWLYIVKKNGDVVIRMTSDNESGDRIDLSQGHKGKWIEIFDPCNLIPGELYYYDLLMRDADGRRRVIRKGEVVILPTRSGVEDE